MKNLQNQESLIQFEPAQLFSKNLWYVQYKVINPFTGKLATKRNKLNRINPISERKKFAKHLINSINQKLYRGWNPFLEEAAPKGFTLITEALTKFYKTKEKELRPDSLRSYKSYVKTINTWLTENDLKESYILNFTEINAKKLLEDCYEKKNLSNKTYNNYLLFFRTLWNWFISEQFCKTSPFTTFKNKKNQKKDRVLIPEETRTKIKKYLKEHNEQLYIVSLLVFHTLLRPKEITHLKKGNFNLNNQTITVPASVSKNGNLKVVTIPDVILEELIRFNFNNSNEIHYIFGLKGQPSNMKIDPREFTREWAKMRTKLTLPNEMKLYSLRDSGIVQLLIDGVSPNEVMLQADHSSLETTTIYLKHANPTGSDQIKEKNSSF